MLQKCFLLLAFGALIPNANAEPARGSSVYQLSTPRDSAVIGLSSLAILVPTLQGSHWVRLDPPRDPNSVNALDRHVIGNHNRVAETLSDVTLSLAVTAPLIVDGFLLDWKRAWVEDSVVFLETLSVSVALVTMTKFAVQRPRPRTYAGDPDFVNRPEGYVSFYSGHTSTTFAALTAASMTLNYRYDLGIWPWLVTAGVGTAVALERVAAGWHFYTDVAVGALVGAAVGYAVPYFHRRERSEAGSSEMASPAQVSFVPRPDSVQVLWSFRY